MRLRIDRTENIIPIFSQSDAQDPLICQTVWAVTSLAQTGVRQQSVYPSQQYVHLCNVAVFSRLANPTGCT